MNIEKSSLIEFLSGFGSDAADIVAKLRGDLNGKEKKDT
jgi:hypothetical protein